MRKISSNRRSKILSLFLNAVFLISQDSVKRKHNLNMYLAQIVPQSESNTLCVSPFSTEFAKSVCGVFSLQDSKSGMLTGLQRFNIWLILIDFWCLMSFSTIF